MGNVINIFEKQYVIVPLHLFNHWTVIIFEPIKKIIHYFDSFINKTSETSKLKVSNVVKPFIKYLQREVSDKCFQYDLKELKVKIVEEKTTQLNSVDCGLFMILYITLFLDGKSYKLVDCNEMEFIRKKLLLKILTQLQDKPKIIEYIVDSEEEKDVDFVFVN